MLRGLFMDTLIIDFLKNDISLFLKNKKTTLAFRNTTKRNIEIDIIQPALQAEKHPFSRSESFCLAETQVKTAYCPTLNKHLIAFFATTNIGICVISSYLHDDDISIYTKKHKITTLKQSELIFKEGGRFCISIPFELKDSLKSEIPSAKFCGDTKRWSVGARSGGKLNLWVLDNEESIISLNKIKDDAKTAKEERLSKKVSLHIPFDFKDPMKEKFSCLEWGEVHGIKSWYVDVVQAEEANLYLAQLELLRSIEKQDFNDGDGLNDVSDKLQAIVDDFDTTRNNHVFTGFIASYKGKNPKIKDFLLKIQDEIFEFNAKKIKVLSSDSKATVPHFKTKQALCDTLLFFVVNSIRNNLDKALMFCDENDNKTQLWTTNKDELLNWVAQEAFVFAKLDNELIIEF